MKKTSEELERELERLQFNVARLLKTIESGYGVVPLDFEFMLVDRLIPSEIKKLYK